MHNIYRHTHTHTHTHAHARIHTHIHIYANDAMVIIIRNEQSNTSSNTGQG